jgi:translation initiation factor 2 beta subunit (eIF-2beta)/eIF-5
MSDSLQVTNTSSSTQALYKLLKFKDLNGNLDIEKYPDLKSAPAIAKIDSEMVKASLDKIARTEIIKIINKDLKTSYPDSNEGYKNEADINRDGKIVPAEARLYLQSLKNISPADKQRFALTKVDQKVLFALFCEALEDTGNSKDQKLHLWQMFHKFLRKKQDILQTIDAFLSAGFNKNELCALLKKAVGAIKNIKDPRDKVDALKYLASRMAKLKLDKADMSGLFNEILEIAGTVGFKYFGVADIKDMASEMSEAGMDMTGIRKAFDPIKIVIPVQYIRDNEYGIYEVISALAAIGNDKNGLISFLKKTLVAAATIKDKPRRERTIMRIVSCMGSCGMDQKEISNALENICLDRQFIIRAFKKALSAAGNIKDPREKERALGKLNLEMANAGLDKDEIGGIFKEETLREFGIKIPK